jgi:hypothetical protein
MASGLRLARDPRAGALNETVGKTLTELGASVAQLESVVLSGADSRVGTVGMTLGALLGAFLSGFAGRAATRDRLHIFTTNYDRLIEWGAERAGLRQLDRFLGTLEPQFRSSRLEVDFHYAPPGSIRDPRHLDGVFRLSKLHGSLDWNWDESTRTVRRVARPFGSTDAVHDNLLIYPNAAKDSETTFFPYADLFRDLAASICRPNSVLVTYGYSFGDDHINRIIADMLTLPSTHLLAISYDDASGRIGRFVQDRNLRGQISRIVGPDVGTLTRLVEEWMPWSVGVESTDDAAQQNPVPLGRVSTTGTQPPDLMAQWAVTGWLRESTVNTPTCRLAT